MGNKMTTSLHNTDKSLDAACRATFYCFERDSLGHLVYQRRDDGSLILDEQGRKVPVVKVKHTSLNMLEALDTLEALKKAHKINMSFMPCSANGILVTY